MDSMWMTIVVVIYLFAVGYLGYRGFKATKTASDYLVAGRRAHPYVMAMSYGATFISTSAIVGFGGAAGVFGMGLLWLTFMNIFFGIFIAFVFFGGRTRSMGLRLDAHTFPELMGRRFQSRFIQGASALIIFLFMPLYASAVLIGAAKYLAEQLGMPYEAALFLFSVIIALYVIMGGIKGVMYTDALQGTIMLLGMITLIILTYWSMGGIVKAHSSLTALASMVPEKLAKGGHMGWTSMPHFGSPLWWTLVSTIVMGVGIGVLAQPQLAVRYMTVKSGKELNRGVPIGGFFILMMTGVAFVVGALTNVYFFNSIGKISIAAAAGDVEKIIPMYLKGAMPGWFGVLFMLTLLSAAMSTISSQFHVMGTSLGRDLVEQTFRKGKSAGGGVFA
ncbi:MAG: sodium:solute symporter family protein, partial [Lentisphaerota bacterium]